MTAVLDYPQLKAALSKELPGIEIQADGSFLLVSPEDMHKVCERLTSLPAIQMDYLTNLTAADYPEYIEIIFHLNSITHNTSATVKTRLTDKKNPKMASVVDIWRGAELQEREIYDLFGVFFENHIGLKRIFLWEGFEGYPLRKDFVNGH
ncbi:NADH-quinone oxidoreductase subunit C [Dehalococcoides mccartyi]|uniref:NADH-quinone oxidoreductase subunit C n=1 Tax=Dehalococcoides mccartyi TaxID=61435 RepID=UPI0006BDB805|nr:NADH-quinone oxidoreductase subunit C [Dehalococcoides mccartyi]AQU07355.1 NADH-quinone oxidoreductase subunit C [Dehalococcoides mccartyi]PKH46245.1 NADH-quinone oxidoreductase subunit C [Dehalococcoides mccartyi]BAS31878.1 NADH ubiquinone oxidoreductase chain C [Dehalococcoides mccartyi IBARAKI]